jgi:hypothetical protein
MAPAGCGVQVGLAGTALGIDRRKSIPEWTAIRHAVHPRRETSNCKAQLAARCRLEGATHRELPAFLPAHTVLVDDLIRIALGVAGHGRSFFSSGRSQPFAFHRGDALTGILDRVDTGDFRGIYFLRREPYRFAALTSVACPAGALLRSVIQAAVEESEPLGRPAFGPSRSASSKLASSAERKRVIAGYCAASVWILWISSRPAWRSSLS